MTPQRNISSRFADLVGIRYPVVQEGLGPYKTVRLAAAVSNAGGLGTVSIPGISEEPTKGAAILREYTEQTCELTDKPFAVNVPVGRAENGEVLPFSAAYVGAVVDADSGLIHAHKIGGTRQAVRAREDGVDVIVASGFEAGGHTHARPVHTFILGPNVVAAVDCPVILAGGIRDGATMAAALALGADAVALGTRFVASHDNTDWHPAYAQRIIEAGEGDDIIFSAIYGPSRALRSKGVDDLAEIVAAGTMDHVELTAWKDDRLIRAQRDGVVDDGILPAGNVSSAITDLIHVAEFVPAIVHDAIAALESLGRRVVQADPERGTAQ